MRWVLISRFHVDIYIFSGLEVDVWGEGVEPIPRSFQTLPTPGLVAAACLRIHASIDSSKNPTEVAAPPILNGRGKLASYRPD